MKKVAKKPKEEKKDEPKASACCSAPVSPKGHCSNCGLKPNK